MGGVLHYVCTLRNVSKAGGVVCCWSRTQAWKSVLPRSILYLHLCAPCLAIQVRSSVFSAGAAHAMPCASACSQATCSFLTSVHTPCMCAACAWVLNWLVCMNRVPWACSCLDAVGAEAPCLCSSWDGGSHAEIRQAALGELGRAGDLSPSVWLTV